LSPTASSVCRLSTGAGFRSTGRLAGNAVRAHVSGTDLVCDRAGRWLVLEDNLRVPSGTGYAVVNQRLLSKHLPELRPPVDDRRRRPGSPDAAGDAACGGPPRAPDDPVVVLLSPAGRLRLVRAHLPGREMGVALVQPSDLSVSDGKLLRHIGSDTQRIDVVYVRMDEDMLLSSTGYDGAFAAPGAARRSPRRPSHDRQRPGQRRGRGQGDLRVCPAMIEYYLGEKPSLAKCRRGSAPSARSAISCWPTSAIWW